MRLLRLTLGTSFGILIESDRSTALWTHLFGFFQPSGQLTYDAYQCLHWQLHLNYLFTSTTYRTSTQKSTQRYRFSPSSTYHYSFHSTTLLLYQETRTPHYARFHSAAVASLWGLSAPCTTVGWSSNWPPRKPACTTDRLVVTCEALSSEAHGA